MNGVCIVLDRIAKAHVDYIDIIYSHPFSFAKHPVNLPGSMNKYVKAFCYCMDFCDDNIYFARDTCSRKL